MAVQMRAGVVPALRRVMARFLARLGSMRDTLLGDLWTTLTLSVPRSTGAVWALVLNCSSKPSMFSSWWERQRARERGQEILSSWWERQRARERERTRDIELLVGEREQEISSSCRERDDERTRDIKLQVGERKRERERERDIELV